MEDGGVRGLVEGPDVGVPPRPVDLLEGAAVGQDAVVEGEIEAIDLLRRARGAMVRVVEEEEEFAAPRPRPTHRRDQLRLVEFVYDDEIRAARQDVDFLVQRPRTPVEDQLQIREGAGEVEDRAMAVILIEIVGGPVSPPLAAHRLVSARVQGPHQPAEEVGVAVVPVAGERVGEDDDPHSGTIVVCRVHPACSAGRVSRRWIASR